MVRRRFGFENDSPFNVQPGGSPPSFPHGEFRATLEAGSLTSVPNDSPLQRVDPNGAASAYAGVGSFEVIHPELGAFICSGTVVDALHVLSAGHCFDLDDDGVPDDGLIDDSVFHLNLGSSDPTILGIAKIDIHPDFGGFSSDGTNDDLAVVTLASSTPVDIPAYPLFDGALTFGEPLHMVGYGISGFGDVAGVEVDPEYSVKRTGSNRVELFIIDDEGSSADEIFMYDFDGPDGVGFLGGSTLGNDVESVVRGGDSGGPAFVVVDGKSVLAGVNTFEFTLPGLTPGPGEFGILGGGVLIDRQKLDWITSIAPQTTVVSSPDNIEYELNQSDLMGGRYTVSVENWPNAFGSVFDPITGTVTVHSPDSVEATFDAVPESFGDITINERVVAWPGQEGGISTTQAAGFNGATAIEVGVWERPGEIVEFSFTVEDGSFLASDPAAQSLISINGLDWVDTEQGGSRLEPLLYHHSWYLYFETDGEPLSGLEVQVEDAPILVGPHPFEEGVEVAYFPQESPNDIATYTEDGLALRLSTALFAEDATWEGVANQLGISVLGQDNQGGPANGLRIGFLVAPPALRFLEGDFDGDEILTAADIDLLTSALGSDVRTFDVNFDGIVDRRDRVHWVQGLADTFFGDADLDGDVDFDDFVALQNHFLMSGGWAEGNFDGRGRVQFSDFVFLARNFGNSRDQFENVPEPSTVVPLLFAGALLIANARRRRQTHVKAGTEPQDKSFNG